MQQTGQYSKPLKRFYLISALSHTKGKKTHPSQWNDERSAILHSNQCLWEGNCDFRIYTPLTLLKIKNFEKRKQKRKRGTAFGTKVFFLNSLRLYGHPSTAFVSLVLHFTEKVEQQQHGARRQKKIMAKTVHYLWEWGFVLEYKGIKRNFSISDDNLVDWHEAWVDCSVSVRASLD